MSNPNYMKRFYDYQQILFASLDGGNRHLWIKKAIGLYDKAKFSI
jgi:hypothetical protein